jgi:hypothetical protein
LDGAPFPSFSLCLTLARTPLSCPPARTRGPRPAHAQRRCAIAFSFCLFARKVARPYLEASSMPPKGPSEGRAPSKYGGFNFSALAVKVSFTSRSNGTTTEKSTCTHGSRKEDATKRDLWVEVVNLWINKLKVHRAWKKVEVPTHPLSLTCISRYTGHYRDREMGAIQAKGPD